MPTAPPAPIDAAPAVPDSSAATTAFDAQYEAFNTWEKAELQPGLDALATNVYDNAVEAAASAVTATDKAALTAADRVQTGLDRVQTGLDRVQTGLDVAATAAWSASLVPGIAGVASVNGLGGVITIPITHFLTMQAGVI